MSNLLLAIYSFTPQIEASILRSHEEAVAAWRAGRLPTADPPASSLYEVSTS